MTCKILAPHVSLFRFTQAEEQMRGNYLLYGAKELLWRFLDDNIIAQMF